MYRWCLSSSRSVNASSPLGDKPRCVVLLLRYDRAAERRAKCLAQVVRAAPSRAHPGGSPRTAQSYHILVAASGLLRVADPARLWHDAVHMEPTQAKAAMCYPGTSPALVPQRENSIPQ